MTRWLIRLVEHCPVSDVIRRALIEAVTDWHYERRGLVAALGRIAACACSFRAGFRNPLGDLGQDVRHALRRLRRSPVYAATAIGTLALGIGVNTAIFSLFNGVMLRSVPVPNLNRVVAIATSPRGNVQSFAIDEADARVFAAAHDQIAATFTSDPLIGALVGDGQSAVVSGELISGPYFDAFKLRAAAGRLLGPADDRPEGQIPIVISAGLWHRWFTGASSAIGATLRMAGHPVTVVGVAQQGFSGTWLPTILRADVWAPAWAADDLRTVQGAGRTTRHRTFALLAPKSSIAEAAAMVRTMGASLPPGSEPRQFTALPAERAMLFDEFARPGRIVGSAVVALSALVFLIACANLANLLLARGAERVPEIAVRLATGASRARVLRLFLVETFVLSSLAAFVSAAIAIVGTRALQAIPLPALQGLHVDLDLSPDIGVLAYLIATALAAAIAIGMVPALRASRTSPVDAIKRGGTGTTTIRRSRLMAVLVSAQISLSLVLLVGAALYARSAIATASIDPGFDVQQLASASVDLNMYRYEEAAGKRFFDELISLARSTPNVTSAVLVTGLPIRSVGGRSPSTNSVLAEGTSLRSTPYGLAGYYARYIATSPGLFATLRIRLIGGRDFTDEDDEGAPRVAIVNEDLARTLWPGRNPIGRRLSVVKDGPLLEVIGLVANTGSSAARTTGPMFFLPLAQSYDPNVTIIARANPGTSASSLLAPLHDALRHLGPEVAFFDERTVAETIGIAALPVRLAALVLGSLGAIALGIAVLGLYGVVAYLSTQRMREFGIRKALGATSASLYSTVVRQAMRMLLPGLAAGVVLAFAGAAFLRALLYGVDGHDPITFAGVTLALLAAGLLACTVPARRASRVDPNAALREL
jgi:predicted permease